MAIGATGVWECRANGSELNGGGFIAAATGIDYSQRDTKRTGPDITNISTTDADLAGSANVVSATANFTSDIIGNIISLSGGTRTVNLDVNDGVGNNTTTFSSATASWTSPATGMLLKISGGTSSLPPQWFRLVSVPGGAGANLTLDRAVPTGTGYTTLLVGQYQVTGRTNATTITVDHSTFPTVGATATMNIGGAISNPSIPLLAAQSSNVIFIKNDATYQTAVGFTSTQGYASPASNLPMFRLKGYGTSRPDGGRPTIQLITNAGLSGLTFTVGGWIIENIIVDCNNLGTSVGITGVSGVIYNCKVTNWTKNGILNTGTIGLNILGNEVTGGSGSSVVAIFGAGTGLNIHDNYVHDNALTGASQGIWAPGAVSSICRNIICNNSGASTDGIQIAQGALYSYQCIGNICYNNGRHGIFVSTGGALTINYIRGNLLANNGGYGIQFANAAGQRACPWYDGNVYYSNTSGTRNNGDDTTVNKQNAVYTNIYDVVLTATPFVNAAGNDFRFNSTSAGSACKNSCPPKAWPGLSGNVSFVDMGPIGHTDQGFAG